MSFFRNILFAIEKLRHLWSFSLFILRLFIALPLFGDAILSAQKSLPERLLFREAMKKGKECYRRSDFTCASDYFFQVLKLAEKLGDSLYVAVASSNLAMVFQETNHLREARLFGEKAIRLLETRDAPEYLGDAYNVMGNIYYMSYKDSIAFYYYRKAIAAWEKAGDTLGLFVGYKNLGALLMEAGQVKEGLHVMEKSLRYLRPSDDSVRWFSAYMTLGEALVYHHQLEKGRAYLARAAAFLPQTKPYYKLNSYHYALYYYHKKKKTFDKALEQHELYKQYSDSVLSLEKSRLLQEMNTRYETEKKETRIRFQEEQIRQERKIRGWVAVSFTSLLLLLTALFVINRQRLQRKTERLLQRQHEKNLQDIFLAEQNERIRIARDLHDSIGQKLAVIKMLLSGNSRANTDRIAAFVDETAGEVRTISHNLMPEILRFGLIKAVENLAIQINASHNIRTELEIDESLKTLSLNEETELTLYRTIQELVSNILRHARSDSLSITLKPEEGNLCITITDKGVGFDPRQIHSSEGLGWKNIEARIRLLGGTFSVQSEPNRGSKFEIKVPLPPAGEEDTVREKRENCP